MTENVTSIRPRDRLERQEDKDLRIRPFLRAPEHTFCELYWISVSAFPPGQVERDWLSEFLRHLHLRLASEHGLRGEFFLQFTSVGRVEKTFRKLATELFPQIGLARKPNAPLPAVPSAEQLKAAAKAEGSFDIMTCYPDYCYWLRHPDVSKLLTDFFGIGGSAMFYLKPDPATRAPEIPFWAEFKKLMPQLPFDKLESVLQASFAMKDGFLGESKKLFGPGLEQEPEFAGIPYILPLLETKDFFEQPEEERKKWFQLFQLFWRESQSDKGIYIASALPLETLLISVLDSMKEAGKRHPGL